MRPCVRPSVRASVSVLSPGLEIRISIHRFSGPPRAAKEHKHRPNNQQEITPSIHRFTGTKNKDIDIKMSSNSPLVSSDLPDHRERPPNIKHDSKSPLISIKFRAEQQMTLTTACDHRTSETTAQQPPNKKLEGSLSVLPPPWKTSFGCQRANPNTMHNDSKSPRYGAILQPRLLQYLWCELHLMAQTT